MKKLLIVTLLSLGPEAFACGLPGLQDESWQVVGKRYLLDRASPKEVAALPTLVKQQLIIAAKASFQSEEKPIKNTAAAVGLLQKDDGPYVINYLVNGRIITQVETFPGDNRYGVIFEAGTLHIIAENGDDSIFCVDKENL